MLCIFCQKVIYFFLVFSSPPKTLIIDLLMNLMEKISITKEKNKITKRLLYETKKFVIGDVKKSNNVWKIRHVHFSYKRQDE